MPRKKKADIVRENDERLLKRAGFAPMAPGEDSPWRLGLAPDGTACLCMWRQPDGAFLVGPAWTDFANDAVSYGRLDREPDVEHALRAAAIQLAELSVNVATALLDVQTALDARWAVAGEDRE